MFQKMRHQTKLKQWSKIKKKKNIHINNYIITSACYWFQRSISSVLTFNTCRNCRIDSTRVNLNIRTSMSQNNCVCVSSLLFSRQTFSLNKVVLRFLRFHNNHAASRLSLCDTTCIRVSTASQRRFHRRSEVWARAHARRLDRAISLTHSLSRYTGRRQGSKLISYGGPLNTGWRVKSVIKIINGSSARAFPYRRSTRRCGGGGATVTWGASVKKDNAQRSLLRFSLFYLFVSPFLPNMWSILCTLFFFFLLRISQ